MTMPIKYRIPQGDEFYYWGFIEGCNGSLVFVSPEESGVLLFGGIDAEWLMRYSERLLGYDKFENEVYENDLLEFLHHGVGYPEAGFIRAEDEHDCDGTVKIGNEHNIKEELKS